MKGRVQSTMIASILHGRIQRGDAGGPNLPPPPLKITKNIGFICDTGPDPLKNHKATKPAFNVGPVIVVFGSSLLN